MLPLSSVRDNIFGHDSFLLVRDVSMLSVVFIGGLPFIVYKVTYNHARCTSKS